jgi:hypothetical protein
MLAETAPPAHPFAPFIGFAGIAVAMIFGCAGAAYGTAKSGIAIAGVGTYRPDLVMKVWLHLHPRLLKRWRIYQRENWENSDAAFGICFSDNVVPPVSGPYHHGWNLVRLRPRGLCPHLPGPDSARRT